MINKKAQGLPIQTIIIFAILLIVAIILMVFFSGKFGFFSRTLGTCPAQDGECRYVVNTGADSGKCDDKRPVNVITSDCPDSSGVKNSSKGGPCCIAVG